MKVTAYFDIQNICFGCTFLETKNFDGFMAEKGEQAWLANSTGTPIFNTKTVEVQEWPLGKTINEI